MFDFDTLIDRTGTGACKWDRRTDAEKRQDIVPMSIADMEFPVAPAIRDAVVDAAEKGLYGYTDPTDAYRASVVGWMRDRHGLMIAPEDIVSVPGVVPSLTTAVRVATAPGDGVIVQTPVYPPFYNAILRNGRRLERNALINTNGYYTMDFDALEASARKPDVKLLILCSPHNPVGRVWTQAELTRVADICMRNNVTVLSDEIHSDLIMSGAHTPFLCLNDWARAHTILATAPSKTFNVPGLQTANLLIPEPTLRAAVREQLDMDGLSNMNYFGHAATIAAYTEGGPWLDAAIRYIRDNYAYLCEFFRDLIPGCVITPLEGTYLAWIDLNCLGLSTAALERFMRDEAMWILDEGYIFGPEGDGFERINLALPRGELVRATTRFARAYRARFGG